MKSYFDYYQSYDHTQKSLEKVNTEISEKDYPTDVSGFLDADINDIRDTTSQYYLCPIIRRINFEIYVTTRSNISSISRREPFYSNRDYNLEVIYKSNPTSEGSEDVSYGRRSKFICTLDYVCILLIMQFSPPFQNYYF